MYVRVIPRDLFNESKLLKCLGRLSLLVHNGADENGKSTPKITVDHDGDEFAIDQRLDDGGLYVTNLRFWAANQELDLYSIYNSKEAYPLLCMTQDREEIEVFSGDGTLTDEFCDYIAALYPTQLENTNHANLTS